MNTLILSLHVIVCILLVILVLLQAGKEGMGVIFGGGNSSVFGSAGAGGILAKLTAFMAILFVGTCLSYNLLTKSGNKQDSTILDVQLEDVKTPKAPQETPAASQPKSAPESAKPAAPVSEPAVQPQKTEPAGAASAPAAEKKEAPKAAEPSSASKKKQN